MTYNPWKALDADPTLRLVWHRSHDAYGWYDADTHTIYLDPDQGQASLRCTLTHELEHAADRDHTCNRVAAKNERLCSDRAARKLITLPALCKGLLLAVDEEELAEELWVDVDTVRARLRGLTEDEKRTIDERLWARSRDWGAA